MRAGSGMAALLRCSQNELSICAAHRRCRQIEPFWNVSSFLSYFQYHLISLCVADREEVARPHRRLL
jgi:hypothetical protein